MSTRLLRLTLPLSPGESPASYASRLAQRNLVRSARDFCRDMGFPFQDLVDGRPAALATLAALSGAPLASLQDWALVREDHGYRLRGERLVRSALKRDRLQVCPECLAGDATASQARPEIVCYGRTIWQIGSIRTCSIHSRALVEVAGQCGPQVVHDFAFLAKPALKRLDELAQSAPGRASSKFESYLERRVNGLSGEACWLDTLDFHVAAYTCELIGAVSLFGRDANLKRLTEDDWHAAGGAGFDIAGQGPTAILGLLHKLEESYPEPQIPTQGPQAYYGRLYQVLAFGMQDAGYDPVRAVIRQHILETTPVGPGDEIFGAPVEERRLHSIRTASLETGAHPKRLRKILAAAGHLPSDHEGHSDHRVTFRAAAVGDLLAQVATAIPLKGVETYLNCGRVQARLLIDQGFIKPFVAANNEEIGWHAFARSDLDNFLATLLQDAQQVSEVGETVCDIPAAAKRANCGAGEILRLILSRKLKFVGRHVGGEGYLAILVDAAEVRELVRGPEVDGLPANKVAKCLCTTDKVVKALIALGELPTRIVTNPINRCPTKVVAKADLEKFQRSFVSLFEVAAERNEHYLQSRNHLRARGMKPAFNPAVVHATFYRRADLAD